MSWYSELLRNVLPVIVRVASNPNVQKAGEDLFTGIASKIKDNIRNPAELAKLADTLHEKAPELTGAIVANSDAAHTVATEVMPPGSVPTPGTAGAGAQPKG